MQQSITGLDLQFSFSHKAIHSVSPNETGSLIDLHKLITSPRAREKFVQVQNMTRSLNEGYLTKKEAEKLKSDLDRAKQGLGFYFPSGTNPSGHKADGLSFNGCIGFDYDFHFRGGDIIAKGLKEALKQFDFVSLLHYSSGGYGVKGIFQTDLKECDTDLYKFTENQIFTHLASCGITLNHDPHGYGKTCYLAYDKEAYLNTHATAFHIDLEVYEKEKAVKQAQNNRKTAVKHDNNEVKQAVEFLIENKINVASCYNEYLSFTAACLNAFDTEGGDIAFQVLDNSEQFNVSTFRKNFDAHVISLSKPTNGNQATERSILFHAVENGFKYEKKPQGKRLDECQFNNLDLFIVDRKNALERIKADKIRKIIICEDSFIETIENELNAKRLDLKSTNFDTIVCTYIEQSKLSIDLLTGANVYFFGANNLNRKRYTYTANEIERLSKITNVVLFSDTPTYLHIAQHITTIDQYTNNSKVIESDNPKATFVELIKKHGEKEVQYIETSESINRQLQGYEVLKRSELYKADHKKPLFVLYDSNVQLMPEAFAQFENVVFVVNSEKKKCINMSTFCAANSKKTNDALQFIDNDVFRCYIEKILFETVKNQTIAIRRNGTRLERCPNIETVLETEHQIKILYSDATKLQKHIESFTTLTNELSIISKDTLVINDDIKQAQKDLAAEKKAEYFEFLDEIESASIDSVNGLSDHVRNKAEMSRGAKIAYNRLKTLSKVKKEFQTCLDAVKGSYTNWLRTKGRFFAAKVVKTDTKIGKSLQTFRDTTDSNQYTKTDLIEIAKATLNTISGNDAEVWRQVKRICFISDKRIRIDGKQTRIYEAIFLE